MEEGLAHGLPHDELFVYEDALRQGRTVVIAFADDDDVAERGRQIMSDSGAETVDAARESWWIGLRSAEEKTTPAKADSLAATSQFTGEGLRRRCTRGCETSPTTRRLRRSATSMRTRMNRTVSRRAGSGGNSITVVSRTNIKSEGYPAQSGGSARDSNSQRSDH